VNLVFVIKQLGFLILTLGAVLLGVAGWSGLQLVLGDEAEHAAMVALLAGAGVGGAVGGAAWLLTRREEGYLDRRQALLLVVLSWVSAAVLGGLPFFLWTHAAGLDDHAFHRPVASVFEAMSGLTTTGATVLSDIEAVPRSLLLWRSLLHWFGGLGIIVLFVAVLPSLGVGGRRLFGVESPGPQPGGVHPQIRETARVLWFIYAGLTLAEVLALRLAGMDWFDSVCHAFATLATGGFSTEGASVGAYSETIHVIVTFFMLLAGMNFGLFHALFRGKFREVRRDPELRVYLAMLALATAAIAWMIYGTAISTTQGQTVQATAGVAIREAAFNVVAIQTTTGFGTSDFDIWPSAAKLLLVVLMFVGGCAGSTSGGIKVIRIWIAFKVLLNEVERVFRPHVVRPVRVGGRATDASLQTAAVVYIVGTIVLFVLGAFGVLLLERGAADITTAATASVAMLCTIGPGLGGVGPVQHYGWMGDSTLGLLSVLMLMGRLEVLPVLVLVVPSYWRGQ
jgi:trk system potassium uptake protein TrkH